MLTIRDLAASPRSGRLSGDMLLIGSEGGTGTLNAVQSTVTVESGSGPSAIMGLNGGSGTAALTYSGALQVRDYDTDPDGPGAMLAVGVNTDGVSGGVGGLYTGGDYGRVRVEAGAAPATLLIVSGSGAVGRVSTGLGGFRIVSDGAARVIVGSGEGRTASRPQAGTAASGFRAAKARSSTSA